MPDRDACTVAKAKLQCKDYPYSQIPLGKRPGHMQNLSNALYQQPSIVMDEYVSSKKKKKKNPLPLKSVYSLIPRLARHFVALKLYIYSLLPTLGFPIFCSSICVQYNTRSRRVMKNRKGLGYVHLTSTRHHSCEKCSQASPVFCCSSISMYYTERKACVTRY